MDRLGAVGDGIASMLLSSVLVPLIVQFAGENNKDLKTAIMLDIDIIKIYQEQGHEATSWTWDRVRPIARKFKDKGNLVSVENVLKWLRDSGHGDVAKVVETEPGGTEWLEKTLKKIRRDLFGIGK